MRVTEQCWQSGAEYRREGFLEEQLFQAADLAARRGEFFGAPSVDVLDTQELPQIPGLLYDYICRALVQRGPMWCCGHDTVLAGHQIKAKMLGVDSTEPIVVTLHQPADTLKLGRGKPYAAIAYMGEPPKGIERVFLGQDDGQYVAYRRDDDTCTPFLHACHPELLGAVDPAVLDILKELSFIAEPVVNDLEAEEARRHPLKPDDLDSWLAILASMY